MFSEGGSWAAVSSAVSKASSFACVEALFFLVFLGFFADGRALEAPWAEAVALRLPVLGVADWPGVEGPAVALLPSAAL